MQIYLVGGAVRDLLSGLVPHDRDYAFSGDAANFLARFPQAKKVSKSHHIFIVDGSEYSPLEGDSIECDLARRDLTINAFALEENGHLHMHPDSLADLKKRILRPVSPHAFSDDPLRVIRLARFCAQWPDCTVSAEADAQAKAVPQAALKAVAAERVGRELRKALAAPAPGRFFSLLKDCGQLGVWFPELVKAAEITAGPPPWHHESVLEHSLNLMEENAGDELAVWMALCHDLGKITTPADILPHHYEHEKRGEEVVKELVGRLMLPTSYRKAGILVSRLHMKAGRLPFLRIGTRRDLLWQVYRSGFHQPFWKVVNADCGENRSEEADQELAWLAEVKLPEVFQNQGLRSRDKLRELQCQVLVQHGVRTKLRTGP